MRKALIYLTRFGFFEMKLNFETIRTDSINRCMLSSAVID